MSPGRSITFLLVAALALLPRAGADESEPTPTTAFPKENPGAVYPELKIYDAQKNPIRIPREDWAGARQRVASDPQWAKWLANRRSDVDDWMAHRQDKVEWVCGWYHDFVSPKDASQLIFTPDEPGPETLHSASDPQVELTPKLHAAWVYFFRGKYGGEMLQAARLYRLTGDAKYAAWAASQIDFYADNFEKWPANHRDGPPHSTEPTCRIMYQPLDEAAHVIDLVETAQTLGDYVDATRRQHWIDALFKPEAAMLEVAGGCRISNRSCWDFAAVGELAIYCQDDDMWKQAIDGPFRIHDQIARGLTSDYLWFEQSLHYNDYTVQALTTLFSFAQMAGRGAELQQDMETTEDLMLSPAEMRFPTGQLPNPADGGKAEHAPSAALWSKTARLFPTPMGVYELAHDRGWPSLLDPPDPALVAASLPPLPPVISRSFESSRMAVLHSGPWQVYLHYGQLTSAHAQAEALNYEAFFNNTDVTQDPGTVGYGSPMCNAYYRAGVCHNVPLVDGVGQISWDPGHLDGFSDTSVSASQPHYQPTAQASRILAIDNDSLKDTVRITTQDGKPHALGFLLHLMGKVENLPANFVPEPNPGQIEPDPGFTYWKDASRATFHDRAEFDVKFDAVTLHVKFDLPGDFTLWHASAPDLLPRRRDVFYLETHGQDATLQTTLTPASGGA
jgi:hypothetical protein